jgi:KaiC/GvpD/RAD55 family RecA-like ATPase
MESFKTYLDEQEMLKALGDQHEALNVQQRLKLKRSLVRNKAKLKMGAKRAERRVASTEVLKKRAMGMARKLMLKRILKDKDKSELTYSQRQTYEKQLATRKAGIARLAQKLIPKMRKLDIDRRSGGARTLNLTTTGGVKPPPKEVEAKPAEKKA